MKDRRTFILVALPYATGQLHLGRLAGTFFPADVYRRYLRRFRNEKVEVISGLDSYGPSVYLEARENKVNPAEYVRNKKLEFLITLNSLGFKVNFSDTTIREHRKCVNDNLNKLLSEGKLFLDSVPELYCRSCDRFLYDRFLVNDKGVSHQKFYESLSFKQRLQIGRSDLDWFCIFCNQKTLMKDTKCIKIKYDENEANYVDFKENFGLCQNRKQVSRPSSVWGLKLSREINDLLEVPSTVYVWIEALHYYRTILEMRKFDPDVDRICYFYGKDNDYFHKVILNQLMEPSLRISCTKSNSFVRNYLLLNEKEKFSTSKKNYLTYEDFKNEYSVAQFRFGLAYYDPLTKDQTASKDLMKEAKQVYARKILNTFRRVKGMRNISYERASNTDLRSTYLKILRNYLRHMDRSQIRLAVDQILKFQTRISFVIDQSIKNKTIRKTYYDIVWARNKLEQLLEPITTV